MVFTTNLDPWYHTVHIAHYVQCCFHIAKKKSIAQNFNREIYGEILRGNFEKYWIKLMATQGSRKEQRNTALPTFSNRHFFHWMFSFCIHSCSSLKSSLSAEMYVWAICSVSNLLNFLSFPRSGMCSLRRSKASFNPFILFLSRALAALRRFTRVSAGRFLSLLRGLDALPMAPPLAPLGPPLWRFMPNPLWCSSPGGWRK